MDEFKWISLQLPTPPDNAVSGCGPHSYSAMHLFLAVAKPVALLEIGFNIGRSAIFWMKNGVFRLVSLEIRQADEVLAAEQSVKKFAEDRRYSFSVLYGDSKQADFFLKKGSFDSAFIDGGHEYDEVVADIEMCRRLGIKKMFFDDWLTTYGGTMQAIKDSKLKIVFTSGNMAYCIDEPSELEWK